MEQSGLGGTTDRESRCLETLGAIWAEVLGRDLDPARGFFEMGGDSMAAMRVVARVYDALGVELPVRALFEAPRLRAFAARVAGLLAAQPVEAGQARPALAGAREAPLSYAQEGLLFLDRAGLAGQAYNVPLTLRLRGALDPGALDNAFSELVRRHESLRTRFELVEGRARQVVDEARGFRAQRVDLSDLPLEAAQARARRLGQEAALAPFDLGRGPLLRALLARVEAEHHVLLIVTHHIVSDGWSLLSVLTRELGELYASAAEGRAFDLPAPSVQYADFARWQREWLHGPLLERERQYWRERLDGAPPALLLPTDRPRPPIASTRGAGVAFTVPATTCDALRELGQARGATLFMVVLAAYQALLSRWSGQTDILVGSPAAGRARREFEGLIGYFVNSLILRADLSADPTFRELLDQVKETTLSAFSHQDLPFEKLVAELRPERDLSRQPVVQVSLSFQNFPREVLRLPGLDVSWVDDEPVTSKFDLSLYVHETPAGLRGVIEYARDLFEPSTVERFAASFQRLLAGAARAPDTRVSRLPLLDEAERAEAIARWNATDDDVQLDRCIHELIAEQAARAPDAVAVVDAGGELTYAELERRANRLAQHLRDLGVAPEVVVGLCLRRTARMVVGLLGILKAGGVYLPLDEQLPAERMAYLLEDAGVAVLVTETALEDALPSHWGRVVRLDDDDERGRIDARPELAPVGALAPDNLAYLIHTSGSTGDPKGVLITHRALVNLLDAHRRAFDVRPGDRVLQFTRLSFDVSLLEILLTLRSGAALYVLGVPPSASIGPELMRLLEERRITIAMLPPPLLVALPEQPLPALRLLFTGGEALDPALAERWARGRRFINEYGITETTVCATLDEHAGEGASTSIGRPIANVRAYVLDRHLEPLPSGVIGELYVAGAGVARGYRGHAALTAERFVPDPWGPAGSRMYASGDRVRRRADGRLDFVGRTDHQVKVRGHRVELGEIEAALLKSPAVEQAVVLARQDAPGDPRLVAYVVGAGDRAPDARALREQLRARLPEYMLPAAFVVMDAFPLTSNRKVDRRKLPPPGRHDDGAPYTSPDTPAAQALASIWRDVLKVDRVGLEDQFFDLGGDSILALRVQSEAQKAGLHFSLAELFEAPQLSRLAERASRGGADPSGVRAEPFALVSPGDRAHALQNGYVDAYPLSRLQLGMLFHSAWERGSRTYHAATSHRLDKPLDPGALQAAVQALVDRHPTLRTTFHLSGYDEPLQCVHRSVTVRVETDDWSQLDGRDQEERLAVFVEAEKRRGFDLARGPLVRFYAHRLGRGEFQLTMSSHHAILDGWSDAAVLTELYEDYLARLSGEQPPAKAPLEVTFRDFIAAERRALASAEHEAYWSRVIEDLPPFNLWLRPKGAVAPEQAEHDAADNINVRFDESLLRAVADFAARARVPVKSVFFAAHLHALRVFTGAGAVVTGLVTNARLELPQGDEVPGLYLNTVPVLFQPRRLHPRACWLDLARHALTLEEQVLRHRFYPVVEVLRRHAGRDTLEVMFDFVNFHVYSQLAGRLRVEEWKPVPQTNFPLVVCVRTDPHVGHGELAVTFHVNRIDAERVRKLAELYMLALDRMTRQPEATYARSPLLPDADRARLDRWNATSTTFPSGECLHDLVAARAAREPDAVALVCEAARLTYRELDERSNQWAHHLRSLGVGPDVIVGLCLDRSPELVVALLGILKAGGAYLPLDPGYPEERLALMMEETRVPILVTRGELADALPSHWAHVVDIDGAQAAVAGCPVSPLDSGVRPQNLAYVIYTSGSSGKPKGVLVPHAGLCNLVRAQSPDFGARRAEHVLQFASLNFDASIWEIATTLSGGATLHLAPPDRALAGAELERTLRERGITIAIVAPSVLHSLGDPRALALPALRLVVVGGEACPPDLARAWASRWRLVNAYGPTETSVCASYGDLSAAAEGVHLGRPVANVRLYVLTEDLEPTPVGVAGELYIGGAGVGRGYLGRPGLTAERFVADPFSGGGGRLYRTGDVVRHRNDGTLEFLGRADRQVKLRGFRIELDEIEAALAEHPLVAQAAATLRGEGAQGTLTAYVVGSPHEAPDATALRAHLRRKLPEHMVPAAFVTLDALPLNAHGKLDRHALPAPGVRPASEGYVEPRTDVEARLAAMWAEVLKLERVGAQDDFFALGGHSLVATRVIAWIGETLGVDLPIRAVFDAPTVAALAERIENERWLSEQARQAGADSPASGLGGPSR